jgi:hypothetical protein
MWLLWEEDYRMLKKYVHDWSKKKKMGLELSKKDKI